MITRGESVLVGLSGGADSVTLLLVLNELKEELGINKIIAAHLNHGLREAADNDMQFCKDLCSKYHIDFFGKRVDVKNLAETHSTCEEDAGRIARYEFFKELSEKYNINKIATAHNMNDQAETFLMRVVSGSTLSGLACVKPVREDGVIRPIIDVRRDEIEMYLESKGQNYVTDETNLHDLYRRNSFRLNLIPYITENYNPNFIETAAMMAQELARDSAFIEKYADDIIKKSSFPLSCEQIKELDDAILIRVISGLCGVSFNKNAKLGILEFIRRGKTGASFPVNRERYLYLEYGNLYLKEYKEKKEYEYILKPGVNYIPEIEAEFILTEGTVYDKDSINISDISDLKVRSRLPGDRIYIKKIGGSKKIKDVFIDKKVPKDKRDIWPLVCENGKIVWLTGIYKNENENIKYNIKVKWRQTNV